MTVISSDLCESFARREKGRGKPRSDAVCGVCDAIYRKHYPVGDAKPKLAFPVLPTECSHYTKKDGRRGKPSTKAACAVCERAWDQHHPRGKVCPVKHPERVLEHQIGLTAKKGSLVKTGVDRPAILAVVEEPVVEVEAIIEPPPAPDPEPETAIIETPLEPAQEPETAEVEPEVKTIIEPPAEAFAEPEQATQPKGGGMLAFWQEQEEEEVQRYMRQGMTRTEAEGQIEKDNDW